MNIRKVVLTSLMVIASMSAFAGGNLAEIKEMVNIEIPEQSREIKNISTDIISYNYGNDGYLWHVGIFDDGCISTSLEGPNYGKQEIYMNGYLLDSTWSSTKHRNHTTFHYAWCVVHTYKNKVTLSKH